MSGVIRPATIDDAESMLVIHVSAIFAHGPAAYSDRQVAAWVVKPEGTDRYTNALESASMEVVVAESSNLLLLAAVAAAGYYYDRRRTTSATTARRRPASAQHGGQSARTDQQYQGQQGNQNYSQGQQDNKTDKSEE